MCRWLAIAAALMVASSASAQSGTSGGWGVLPGEGACLATAGPEMTMPEQCQATPALVGAMSGTLTPDGRALLVAGGTDYFTFFGHGDGYGSLAAMSRDPESGLLSGGSCTSSDGGDGIGAAPCDLVRP